MLPEILLIADGHDVGDVLDGRTRNSADRVRVTGRLINAGTDAHLWAELVL